MTSIVLSRAPAALKPLVIAVAIANSFPAFAQTTEDTILPTVIVTASRFTSDPVFAPVGATVITATEIRESGINNVDEAIRKIGGVYGRQSPYGTQDFDLDLRGFGTNSSQNMVVLIDGVRISENDLNPALFSSIPIETVERIEIMRGGSSVLYGEGATGGVIQIITKRPSMGKLHASVVTELGLYRDKEIRTSVAKGWDGFALDAHLSEQRADNYRDNNAIKQQNFSTGAQWASKAGRIGIRADIARQDSRFAGALDLKHFDENPRQTQTPNDYGSIDSNRYTAFIERNLGAWDVAAELSQREKTSHYFFDFGGGFTSSSTYTSKQTQFSPRVRNLSNINGMLNELVLGLDFGHWNRVTESSFSQENSTQNSQAGYVRDEMKLGKTRVAAGVRREVFQKNTVNPSNPSDTYGLAQSFNAWELQGTYAATSMIDVFAKTGQSYRVANADENGYTPQTNAPLVGQTSHDLELGSSFDNKMQKLTVKLFQHQLQNEIFFNPIATAAAPFGSNVNLPPTRRRGIEIDASTRLASTFALSTHFQHVNAVFTDGPNVGNEMVMVPKNTAFMRINWLPGNGQSAAFGMQWVDKQRYGGDFSNTCIAKIPSYTIFDARYAKRIGAWELAIVGDNLADKHYFSNAYGCSVATSPDGIYPSYGRQVKVSARYDF